VKATQRDFLNVAQRAGGSCAIWFFCGPDEGGAALAASRAVAMLPDAGERVELSGADLKADPVRLADEARSTSLFGGARHIYVRVSGEEALKAVETYLELAEIGEMARACPVFIVAASATDKSRTAKLLIDRKDAIVAMFHPAEMKDVVKEIQFMAAAAGVKCSGELVERMARAANMDLRLARSEMDKLALYIDADPQAPRTATAEALDAIGAATEEEDLQAIVNVVLSGEVRKVPDQLARIRDLGINPVTIVLALERRTAQLASLSAKLTPREEIVPFLERNGVFFRDRRDIEAQLRRWPSAKLSRLVGRLAELHSALMGNSQSAELLLAQSLTQIARYAAPPTR
jgi:DNA polymerase-3 subunit delta